jgi:hypothetical protein
MHLDISAWSGDGDFTTALVEALKGLEQVAFLKVEDRPATRAETGYNFLSTEIYVGFRVQRAIGTRRAGFLRVPWPTLRPVMTLDGLEDTLAAMESIGPADYADGGMLQFLRAERVIPPYQVRGYKLVELVRVYEARPVGRAEP